MEYQQSFCSHSTTLIKVIPIGNIPLVVFNKYLTSLVDHWYMISVYHSITHISAIPVCEYPNILRLPNFSYYSDILWEKGMISISFITDDTFLSKDTSTPYDSFFVCPHSTSSFLATSKNSWSHWYLRYNLWTLKRRSAEWIWSILIGYLWFDDWTRICVQIFQRLPSNKLSFLIWIRQMYIAWKPTHLILL